MRARNVTSASCSVARSRQRSPGNTNPGTSGSPGKGVAMYATFGLIHAHAVDRLRAGARPDSPSERGQGTVEYVGLVLLVAALMGGMVAAVGGLGSLSGIGKELAEAITKKIVQGVQKITFGCSRPRRRARRRAAIGRARRRRVWDTAGRCRARSYERSPADHAPGRDRARLRPHRRRLGADLDRRDAGDLHGVDRRRGAAMDEGARPRLGDRRVRDAPRLDRRAQGARLEEAAAPTAARSRSSA